jgi:ribosomal protein S26
LRGRSSIVICNSCGRKVPRNKAVSLEKGISFSTDTRTTNDIRFFERQKLYYCISCAKHRGVFEKKKRLAEARSRRLV